MSFSRETTKKFGGRIVRIGDKAKAHMRVGKSTCGTTEAMPERLEDFVGVVDVSCSRVESGEPVWLADVNFGEDVVVELAQVTMPFVESEALLVQGTWTWGEVAA
jgi:hypothetical protein